MHVEANGSDCAGVGTEKIGIKWIFVDQGVTSVSVRCTHRHSWPVSSLSVESISPGLVNAC